MAISTLQQAMGGINSQVSDSVEKVNDGLVEKKV